MGKITATEFENYSKQFHSFFIRMLKDPSFQDLSEKEKKKGEDLLGLMLNEIKRENIFALRSGCESVESVLKEDLSAIKEKVKEHIIARGNYNSASPLSLAEFRQRRKQRGWEKWKKILQNQELYSSLLLEMDGEDYHLVNRIFSFWKELEKIFPEEKGEELTEENWKETGFFHEDLLKTFEKAYAKLEAKKKNGSPNQPDTSDPNLNQKLINQLEKEKKQLEEQKKALENQSAQSEEEKKLKDRLLAENNRNLAEKEKEIEELRRQKKPQQPTHQNQNDNSSLVKWAIGLSVVAIVIGIIALILWLKPRKRVN